MIETFIADPDTPFTCPYDGTRTEYVDVVNNQYVEACPCCGQIFNFEFDEEDYHE
jgi:transcription elongation factor Elf1